jgi:hypothetical protein
MKMKPFISVIGVGAAATMVALAATWASTGCEQPDIDCRAARGDFAVKFTQIEGDCGGLTVGFVGLESFHPSADGETQDYGQVNLAIQSEAIGNLMQGFGPDPDPNHKPYGLGTFAATEPSGDVCTVPTFSPAQYTLEEIPGEGGMGGAGGAGGGEGGAGTGGAEGGAGGMGGAAGGAGGAAGGAGGMCPDPGPDPGFPATDIQMQWSNVRVYVTPAAPGTQFTAELAYSETVDGVSCSSKYKLVGLWPVVDCGIYEFDECDNLISATPNEAACHLDPANAPPGSVVINPDFNVTCDPDLLVCVVADPVAELKN